MGRPKKVESDVVPEVQTEQVSETKVDVAVETVSAEKEVVKFPEVPGLGVFQAVKVGSSYAVYNPDGARVSGLMSWDEAKDIVRQQNLAGHLKVKPAR
jgi:ABC-type Na+ efflux pump permease subunit